MKLLGAANNVGDSRALLGEFTASPEHAALLRSVVWSAVGHGDVVFILAIDFDELSGIITPGAYHDRIVARQAQGEDMSPVAPLKIPSGGTARFLARAKSGAETASFQAALELLP